MKRASQHNPGYSANAVMLPMIAVLAVLHLCIVILIFGMNTTSMKLSKQMQQAGQQTAVATLLLAGSSLMSETSGTFILMPLTEEGEPNVLPLIAYANELGVDRRGDQVVEKFRDFPVSE